MISKELISHSNPKSPISEAYRVLRTNIQYSSIDKPIKTILVTSSGPSEGKTTTIANMAITFAQSGSKVLLIDADLRKPRVHKIFGIFNRNGLSNLLATHGKISDFVCSTDIPNLSILSCGTIPPNPSELLASNSMKTFISDMRESFDMVLIDAPPVGAVTDAAILATVVDGTVIVASSGIVATYALERAKELLDKVNARIIGVVLNRMKKSLDQNYGYYYYDYSNKENEDTNKFSRPKKRKSRKQGLK